MEQDAARSNRLVDAGATVTRAAGLALVVLAVAANQRWLDEHFLPSFFLPRDRYVALETSVRVLVAIVGVAIASPIGTRIVRSMLGAPTQLLRIGIAVGLALGAAELTLRHFSLFEPADWLPPNEEPRRQLDSELGWTLAPSRTGESAIGGRRIFYSVDASGFRVPNPAEPVDFGRPSIIFTGESVMLGESLTWDESMPGQVSSTLGVQSANMAVQGYSNDQAYLRLKRELPKFRHPLMVVTIFMSTLFGRNLDDDRPHLGQHLRWMPAVQQGRLQNLAKTLVPFHRAGTVERGIAVTRDILRATRQLANDRGASFAIIVPQFGSESPAEVMLRQRVFDDIGMSYQRIELDAGSRLPGDLHPNAHAAHVMAEAITERLRSTTR